MTSTEESFSETNQESHNESDLEDDLVEIEMSKQLQLIVNINNSLVQTINYLKCLNGELCKMVSNVNNLQYVIGIKCDEIQKQI